jgi:hypothetical protein
MTPARQVAFGNPNGDGTLSSSAEFTFDPSLPDFEMALGDPAGPGAFNVLDGLEENGISIEAGNSFLVASLLVALQAGAAEVTEQITLGAQPGQGVLVQSNTNGIQLRSDGGKVSIQPLTTAKLSFFNGAGAPQQSVTGSLSDGTALKSLLTALAALGLVVDNTTP